MEVVKYLYQIAIASLLIGLLSTSLEARTSAAVPDVEIGIENRIEDGTKDGTKNGTKNGVDETEQASFRLTLLLEKLHGIRHPFVQQVYASNGVLQETSSGEVGVLPPNVRWEVSDPFPQTILLDGTELKIFDPDLEQLTVRDIAAGWAEVPIALLINGAVLADHFSVYEITPQSFSLQPLAKSSLIREIRLEWPQQRLDTIAIYDHADQLITVQFKHQSIPEMLQSAYFEMALPPGTEVVRG